MMAQENIPQRLHQLLEIRSEISFAYLHGSFVAQSPQEDGLIYHDVDVALYLDPPLADLFDYEMALSVELTRTLHLPIDIQVLNGAPIGFQHQALQGQLLFTRSEEKLTNFIEYVSWEYMQFSHYLRDYLEAVTT
jgi:predicted nucleotidyltransferase